MEGINLMKHHRMNKLTHTILLLLVCVVSFTVGTSSAGASKSTTWSNFYTDIFYAFDDTGQGGGRFWSDTNVDVTYEARVINVDTGLEVNDGASIPVGTQLRFEALPFEDTDIYFNGIGYSWDTPYGYWRSGATSPTIDCFSPNYVDDAGAEVSTNMYGYLSVEPPNVVASHSGTAGMSCDATGLNCTVTSAGTIQTSVSFQSTFGKMYGGARWYGESQWFTPPGTGSTFEQAEWCDGGCVDFGPYGTYCFDSTPPDPVMAGSGWCYTSCRVDPNPLEYGAWSAKSEWTLNVPRRTINFSLTAVDANNPPSPPTISGATTGNIGISYSFDFQSSDPDGDEIRYGIDWDNDGGVDEWRPSSGYVPSGSTESGTRTWTTQGSKTFRALTEDDRGQQSGWTTHTIDITVVAPVVTLNAQNQGVVLEKDSLFKKLLSWVRGIFGSSAQAGTPITISDGESVQLTWNIVNDADSCTGVMDPTSDISNVSGWNGTKNSGGGSVVVGPLVAENNYVFRIDCSNQGVTGPSSSDTVQVTVNTGGSAPSGGACEDIDDNDNDGLIDENDPGCWGENYDLSSCISDPESCRDVCVSDPNSCWSDGVIKENNCGNSRCEAFAGENPLSCPADCVVTGGGEQ